MKYFRRLITAFMLLATIPAIADEYEVLIQPIIKDYPNIQLNINVRDKITKKPIANLKKDDLLIMEDLLAVEIKEFLEIKPKSGSHKPVDIVFVFDDTGSMSEEIAGLIERTLEFADIISGSGFDYKLGLISYKDSIHKPYKSTRNASEFKSWVSSLRAKGGGDEPENALDAIWSASQQTFRENAERIFILITDATFHSNNRITDKNMSDVTNALESKNISLHVVGPNIDEYKHMSQELAGTFYDKDSGQFKRIIDQIAGGSANNYIVKYLTNRLDYDFTWRAVEAKIKANVTVNGVGQYQAPSWVSASSRHESMKGIDSQYSPHNIIDGNHYTEWVPNLNGSLMNQWVKLNFKEAENVNKIRLSKSLDYGSLPTKVAVTINNKGRRYFDIPLNSKSAILELDRTTSVNELKIEIIESGSRVTSIADIELLSGHPLALIEPIQDSHNIRLTQKLAKELNNKGEKLYHKKNYKEAIFNYLQAVKNNPTYAQAYSNLGLAYQRDNQYAKAVWANRKAIALAKGKHRSTVSASSYYNIARIFEAQNKFEQALQNFHWAKSFKRHSAYNSGIARMKKELKLR